MHFTTTNPTILNGGNSSSNSLLRQTAHCSTLLLIGTHNYPATIDTIVYAITEASIRNKLQLTNASGITMLPNNEIFEGMRHMGQELIVWKRISSKPSDKGSALLNLSKKVKKLEGILKRRNVVFSDSEEEEPEDQGRKSQDGPLVSLVQGLVTPSKTTVNNASGENKGKSKLQNPKPMTQSQAENIYEESEESGDMEAVSAEEFNKDLVKNFKQRLIPKSDTKSDNQKMNRALQEDWKEEKQIGYKDTICKDSDEDEYEASKDVDPISGTNIPVNPVLVAIKPTCIATYKIIKQGEKDKKLQGGKPDEDCYKLLKWMEKQAGISEGIEIGEQHLWMVHQLTKFHVQRVDMVINPPWNLPFLGAKGLTRPEQTARGKGISNSFMAVMVLQKPYSIQLTNVSCTESLNGFQSTMDMHLSGGQRTGYSRVNG
ncbi:hypothetical protein Tco_0704828 [Tanacetum coccineum]|uniref:Uncharacterized protein n=1 Tax=Tanacetum coccineum TaxID=301880 RepID=A0ABQ4Y3M6_9ASTR